MNVSKESIQKAVDNRCPTKVKFTYEKIELKPKDSEYIMLTILMFIDLISFGMVLRIGM